MNLLKKHWIISLLILCILLTFLFILGETSLKTTFTEVAQYIPPVQTQTAAVSDFNSNLVAHYTFDDTTNDSAGSNHGTAVGGPTYVEGKIGKAMNFDGVDDYVSAGRMAATLEGASSFTISTWVKLSTVSPSKTFFSKAHVNNDSNWILFATPNNTEDAAGDDIGIYFAGNNRALTTSNFLKPHEWYHMVAVYDGGQTGNAQRVKIYVNGVAQHLTFTGTIPSTSPIETRPVVMGAVSDHKKYFAGSIDDVRIYSRALSPAEISDLYNYTGDVITGTDTTPPSTPTNLGATAVSSSQINVSWTASTDDTAVTGYRVYQNGSLRTTTTSTSYSDVGLSPNTTYSYSISAFDAVPNISPQSTPVSATTGSISPTTYTLTITKSGTGSGTVTAVGINCGSDCTESLTSGTVRTLTATPTSGSTFTGWSGGGCSGTSTCTLVLTADTTVTATFTSESSGERTVTAASCSQEDVQSAINSAKDGDTVLIPAGVCVWRTRVGLNATTRSLALRGSGTDKTTIDAQVDWAALSIAGAEGKSFVVSHLKFTGGIGNSIIQIGGTSKSWRIHHIFFENTRGTTRLINIQGPTYGVIDNVLVRGSTPSEFATVEDASLTLGDGGWLAWQRPMRLGDVHAVYIEDNDVSWTGGWEGRPFIDGELGGRAVVRYNKITNSNFGNHGFDSGYGSSMLRLEVYNNNVTITDSMETWARFGLVRGGTGVWFNNTFTQGPNLWGTNKISLALFRNVAGAGSTWPACNGAQYMMCSNVDKNWRVLDGTWSPEAALSDDQCTASQIPNAHKNYTAKWKFCSASKTYLCTLDSDCPGGETCSAYLDGPAEQKGYPCFQQPGRGSSMQLMPLYEWNNTMSGTKNLRGTTDIDFFSEDGVRIVEGRDYFNDTVMPGYTPYTYPHPLRTNGFTADVPNDLPPPADAPTCTSFTYSSWSTCTSGNQTRTVTSSSPSGCTGGTPVLTQSCSLTTLTADFNSDGRVNSLDFSALSNAWNQNSPTHDLNKDGIVNTLDYSLLIQQWTG